MILVLLHHVAEKVKEKLPEISGITVSSTGVIMDSIGFVNTILELIVKLGYVAVSVFTVWYLIKKARNLKKEGNDKA